MKYHKKILRNIFKYFKWSPNKNLSNKLSIVIVFGLLFFYVKNNNFNITYLINTK